MSYFLSLQVSGSGGYRRNTECSANAHLEKPMSITKQNLQVVWRGSDIVPGCLCYGFWQGTEEPGVEFPANDWPGGTQTADWWLRGDPKASAPWRVLVRTVRVHSWPQADHWHATVQSTLQAFRNAGAGVAWCGLEGDFVDPPDLFDPKQMGEGVWAVLEPSIGFVCAAPIDADFAPVPQKILERLHHTVLAV